MKHSFIAFRATAAVCFAACSVTLIGCVEKSDQELIVSAKEYLNKKDTKGAVIQLKNALQKNLQASEARFLLGKTLLEEGDPIGAELELKKALELKYSEDLVLPLLAKSLLQQGEARKVIDLYAQTKLKDPSADVDLKTTVASAYAMQGKTEAAQAALDAALRASPKYAPAMLLQARLKLSTQDTTGALALVDEIVSSEPRNFEAWALKGDITGAVKLDFASALDAYRKAIDIKKDYLPAHSGIISILMRKKEVSQAEGQLSELKKVLPSHPQTKLFQAQLALVKGDYKAAREISQQLLKVAPDNVRVLEASGMAEFWTGSLAQAESLLSKAVQISPELLSSRRFLAFTFNRSGQPVKALETLKPILDKANPDSETLSLAAQAYLQVGDIKHAEDYFARAAKLNPDDMKSRTALALTQIAQGKTELAFAELQSIASVDKGISADMALISARIQRKEFDGAQKAIDALEGKQPNKPFVPLLRARVMLLRNDPVAARASLERALSMDAAYFPAVAGLAALDYAEKKPVQARKRFEDLLRAEPKNHQAMLALADILSKTGGDKNQVASLIVNAVKLKPLEAGPRVILINHYLAAQDAKLALSAAQDAVGAIPDNPAVLDALGRAQLVAGDAQLAVTTFTKLAAAQPSLPNAHMRLAEAYMASNNRVAAMRSLKRALEIAPDLQVAQRALIGMALAEKHPEEALSVARSVQKQHPAAPTGFILEGDIQSNLKNWDAAIAAYRTALQKDGSTQQAAKLHIVMMASGNRSEADKFAARWEKDHPQDAGFVFHLASIALTQRDFALAENRYRRVVEMQPQNALAFNNIAWLMVEQGKPGAVEYAEKANTLLPGRAVLLDTLALALAGENKMPRALQVQTQAISLDPENPALKLNLAKLYLKAGDKALAKAELEKLVKLGEKFPGQPEVSRLLKLV